MNSISSIYRIIALSMASLMFLTSIGFSVDIHYCQGHLKSFNFFGKAKNCYELANAPTPCEKHENRIPQQKDNGSSIDKKECCHNKLFHTLTDQNKEIQTSEFILSQQLQQFVVAYVVTFFINDFSQESTTADYVHYKSPLIARDISVLIQSFLL